MTKRLLWMLVASSVLSAQAPAPTNADVEMTVYLISGSAQGTADDVPKDLESTVKQLHSVFAYKTYKLSESFFLRGGAGSASTEGVLPGVGLRYRFSYFRLRLSGDAPRAVQLDGLGLELTRPAIGLKDGKQIYETVAKISTNLDMRDGQK
ncbi:MAG: hypothetical protein ACRD4E_04960, partial [Bryobacteraceae bacterium]